MYRRPPQMHGRPHGQDSVVLTVYRERTTDRFIGKIAGDEFVGVLKGGNIYHYGESVTRTDLNTMNLGDEDYTWNFLTDEPPHIRSEVASLKRDDRTRLVHQLREANRTRRDTGVGAIPRKPDPEVQRVLELARVSKDGIIRDLHDTIVEYTGSGRKRKTRRKKYK